MAETTPLKVLIFAWRLFLNRIPDRDKLFHWKVLLVFEQCCIANCGLNEDREHLFLTCGFFGGVWNIIADWLGFSTAFHCHFFEHLHLLVVCGASQTSRSSPCRLSGCQ
jgi:hypothetical protein